LSLHQAQGGLFHQIAKQLRLKPLVLAMAANIQQTTAALTLNQLVLL
jgi:hypothetical protein